MTIKHSLPVLFLALFLPLSAAHAALGTYDLDKVHTQVLFSVDHLGFSHSYGRFTDYDGTFKFDRDHPENSAVDVTIHTASVRMDDQAWEDKLKSDDFFNVEKFPDMSFRSKGVTLTGENTGVVSGDLTLLGMTEPIKIDVVFNKAERHPFDHKFVAGFSGHTRIKRSEFGMDYGLPFVGDDVDIILEVEGQRRDQAGEEQYNQ